MSLENLNQMAAQRILEDRIREYRTRGDDQTALRAMIETYKVTASIDPNTSKEGKLRLAEVHPEFIKILAGVSEVSKEKGYEPLNWIQKDVKCYFVSYLVSAALRHINYFLEGEDFNQEKKQDGTDVSTRLEHLAHAAYGLLMAVTLQRLGRTDLDDRKLKL